VSTSYRNRWVTERGESSEYVAWELLGAGAPSPRCERQRQSTACPPMTRLPAARCLIDFAKARRPSPFTFAFTVRPPYRFALSATARTGFLTSSAPSAARRVPSSSAHSVTQPPARRTKAARRRSPYRLPAAPRRSRRALVRGAFPRDLRTRARVRYEPPHLRQRRVGAAGHKHHQEAGLDGPDGVLEPRMHALVGRHEPAVRCQARIVVTGKTVSRAPGRASG
jgi:hypothetical protein